MTRFKTGLLLSALVLTACGDDETPPLQPSEDHTPESYSIQVNDVAVSAPYTFTAGETVRVRIKFFNAAQEDLDEVEDSHFGGLTFEPASLATVVRDPDHNYQFSVTAGAPATGTLQVGYGHDAAADEKVFGTAAVTVSPGGGPALSQ